MKERTVSRLLEAAKEAVGKVTENDCIGYFKNCGGRSDKNCHRFITDRGKQAKNCPCLANIIYRSKGEYTCPRCGSKWLISKK